MVFVDISSFSMYTFIKRTKMLINILSNSVKVWISRGFFWEGVDIEGVHELL